MNTLEICTRCKESTEPDAAQFIYNTGEVFCPNCRLVLRLDPAGRIRWVREVKHV